MIIAYLTTTYPFVSHTFIRRELRELESRGHKVLRIAIRKPKTQSIDPLDHEEGTKTLHCLSLPFLQHIKNLFHTVLSSPVKFFRAFLVTFKMGMKGKHNLHKHFAYLIEACTLFQITKERQIQHIHAHFGTNPSTIARLIYHLGGPRYSFTVHGPAEFDDPIGYDLPGKISDAAFVIAITDFCSAQLRRWSNPEDWHKVQVVHCTVGDDFFKAAHPLNSESRIFVCVGRLSPQKGQLVLIDAFTRLRAKGYDAKLIFVGDGELRPIMEKKILSANLQEHIKITGYVSEKEVRKYITKCRVMVLPSFAEGLPMVIMEAFAIGRPVISTYIAGIPELVRSGENGWLVPAGNTEALVDTLANALDTPAEKLEEMASSGRELTNNKHHTTREGDRLEKIFKHYVK